MPPSLMRREFKEDPGFTAWGPFIKKDYSIQPITRIDIIVAGCVFAAAMCFALLAMYTGIQQTRASRRPLKSVYVWMVWIELIACVVIAVLCLLYLLKLIRPSFYFYMAILLLWSIQVQLLLLIIINRIRIILADYEKGRRITISVAVLITLINISVFCVWIPARLEISERFILINEVWDRMEKVIYLIVDGTLNWYFIHVVKVNLVKNGLEKYTSLVRFNQRIIIVSLLMDVMIIGAMSIPNSFVYAIFHPLAFLVKLNIEMSMANLIRKIALGKGSNQSCMNTFASDIDNSLIDDPALNHARAHTRKTPNLFLHSLALTAPPRKDSLEEQQHTHPAFSSKPKYSTSNENNSNNEIRILKTREFCVHSQTRPSSNVEDLMGVDVRVESTRAALGRRSGSYYSDNISLIFDGPVEQEVRTPSSDKTRVDVRWHDDEDELAKPPPAFRKL